MAKLSADKNEPSGREKFDELMNKMNDTKEKWVQEADSDDDEEEAKTSQLLDQAIEMAIEQGRGWSPGEKEQYLENILDDDYVSIFFEKRTTVFDACFDSLTLAFFVFLNS